MEKKVRMAIAGLGIMGKQYAEMIDGGEVPGMELGAVCVRRKESGAWAEENLKHPVPVYVGIDELFAHEEEFDAVLIVVPHRGHPEYVRRACEYKKHVFCDKPAGISVTDARNMSRWAREAGVLYAMMFHCRALPKYIKLKEIVDSGKLGRLLRVSQEVSIYRTSFYHRSGSWRSSWQGEGGGLLINQGQHELDMWKWLFGMPEKLRASISFGKYNDFLVDDEVLMELKYKNDMRASIFMTTGEAYTENRWTIAGTCGRAVLEDSHMTVWTYDEDSAEYGKTAQVTSNQKLGMTAEEYDFCKDYNARRDMLCNFADELLHGALQTADGSGGEYDALLYGVPLTADGSGGEHDAVLSRPLLTAPGEDGECALELANGAYLSAWKDTWQTLPVDGEEYEQWLEGMMRREEKGHRRQADE